MCVCRGYQIKIKYQDQTGFNIMFIKAGIKSIIIFNSTRGGEYGRVKFIIKGFTELAASELFIVISLEFERHRFTEVSSIYPSIYFKHTAAGSCSPKAETSATAGVLEEEVWGH